MQQDKDVMTQDVRSMSPQDRVLFAVQAMKMMRESQIRRLPVLDDAQRLVSMLSLGDLATRSDPEAAGFTLAEISEPAQPVRTGASPSRGGAA